MKSFGNGCIFYKTPVENIVFNEIFTITTSNKAVLESEIVIGALGSARI
jgi:hypothetical protein